MENHGSPGRQIPKRPPLDAYLGGQTRHYQDDHLLRVTLRGLPQPQERIRTAGPSQHGHAPPVRC